MNEDLLEKVIAKPPQAHLGDGEAGNEAALTGGSLIGSSLTGSMRETLEHNYPVCYGIDPKVARFLYREVAEGARTLETGSGLSTIIFALRKSYHTAVTPSMHEAEVIQQYAGANQIGIERVNFVLEPSETYLPRCTLQDLDLVLIDGKHAVPWPFIDWFYTAEKLKVGGLCVLESRWEFVWERPRRTIVFRKLSATIHGVAWHQQPYLTRRYGRKARILNALGIKWRPKPNQ